MELAAYLVFAGVAGVYAYILVAPAVSKFWADYKEMSAKIADYRASRPARHFANGDR